MSLTVWPSTEIDLTAADNRNSPKSFMLDKSWRFYTTKVIHSNSGACSGSPQNWNFLTLRIFDCESFACGFVRVGLTTCKTLGPPSSPLNILHRVSRYRLGRPIDVTLDDTDIGVPRLHVHGTHMSVTMSRTKRSSRAWQSLVKHEPAGAAGISTISLGHGAMSGTTFKNQKLHSLCTINYAIWKSDLAQWKDLIYTAITLVRSPVQLPQAVFFFFRNIFTLTSSCSPIYIFMHQKSYTTT